MFHVHLNERKEHKIATMKEQERMKICVSINKQAFASGTNNQSQFIWNVKRLMKIGLQCCTNGTTQREQTVIHNRVAMTFIVLEESKNNNT